MQKTRRRGERMAIMSGKYAGRRGLVKRGVFTIQENPIKHCMSLLVEWSTKMARVVPEKPPPLIVMAQCLV